MDIKSKIKQSLREVPDFPKPGILFYDITTVLNDGALFREIFDSLRERYSTKKIDRVIGLESRGFIFGTPLADRLGVGFAPIRKPGKLPAPVNKVSYETEYSTDTFEIHKDAVLPGERVLIVDDLLATGGTASAAVELLSSLKAEIVECCFILELLELEGRKAIESKLKEMNQNTSFYSLLEL